MWANPQELELLEMAPVPFDGDPSMDPHNELISSNDGIMLLDIPDRQTKDGKVV